MKHEILQAKNNGQIWNICLKGNLRTMLKDALIKNMPNINPYLNLHQYLAHPRCNNYFFLYLHL
jgi:hypothetical protein